MVTSRLCFLLLWSWAASAGRIPTSERGEEFKSAIRIAVPMGQNRTLELNLERSDVINASLPVYVGTDRYSYTRLDTDGGRKFVVYRDRERRSSFVVWSGDSDEQSGMRAIIEDDQHVYELEPVQTRQHVADDPVVFYGGDDPIQEQTVIRISGKELVMTKVNASVIQAADIERRADEESKKLDKKMKEYIKQQQQLGHSYPKYYYEVELFLVVDYALFDKWLMASRRYDYRDRELEAIDNIRFYFAHVLHGINERYSGIDDEALSIRIRPVGIYIAKTRAASYWTEGYGIKESYRYTEAYKALDAFEEWINNEDVNLPPFDQATLFTGNLLFSGWTSDRRRTISGLADIGEICREKRASINRDIGVYASIQTGAHELGHNLGAYHDGYNNPCSSRDQYIMATSPGALNDRNRDNPTKFSWCSRNAIWERLLYLSSQGENCLLTTDNGITWDISYQLGTKPGQRYSADEQCKIVFGFQSFYCGGGGATDQEICSIMYCWDPVDQKCKGNPEQRAADRTKCGDRKWCDSGTCVSDPRAPPASDPDCVYGDYQDVVADNRKCYDLGMTEPHRCYEKTFRSRCCDTCSKIENRNSNSCPFGDRDPKYCKQNTRNSDCYDPNIRDLCCETCAKYETGRKDCEYGDRLSYCPTIQPYQCYQLRNDCCDTCRSPPPGARPGCEWGDKASWCAQLDARSCEDPKTRATCCKRCQDWNSPAGGTASQSCYGPDRDKYCSEFITFGGWCYQNEDRCCDTCSGFFTGKANCQYGDHFLWCADYVADYPNACQRDKYVRDNCCQSCAKYVDAGNTSPDDSCKDLASWCASIHPGQCYDVNTERTCCASCKRHIRSSGACRYGDQVSWCKPEYCSTASQYCCETCA